MKFSESSRNEGKTVEVRTADIIAMRGPYGSGLVEIKNIAFAHRRLAIRDLQSGQQPWVSEDGQTVLVYNGELYNDTDLRVKLIQRGHKFKTRCDTETVLAAYRE